METRIIIILTMTACYFAVMTYIGYHVRKHARSSEGFSTGGRNFPPFLIGALLLSEMIGTSVSIGTAQKGFESGISAAWNLVAFSCGFLLLAFLLVKKYKDTVLNTISAILASNYGERVRYATSALTICALSIVSVALYASGGAVLAAVLQINKGLAILMVGVVTVLYISLGGMRSDLTPKCWTPPPLSSGLPCAREILTPSPLKLRSSRNACKLACRWRA